MFAPAVTDKPVPVNLLSVSVPAISAVLLASMEPVTVTDPPIVGDVSVLLVNVSVVSVPTKVVLASGNVIVLSAVGSVTFNLVSNSLLVVPSNITWLHSIPTLVGVSVIPPVPSVVVSINLNLVLSQIMPLLLPLHSIIIPDCVSSDVDAFPFDNTINLSSTSKLSTLSVVVVPFIIRS